MPELVITAPVAPTLVLVRPPAPTLVFQAVQGPPGADGAGVELGTGVAGENIAGGSLVCVTAAGVFKADADNARPAHGFVREATMLGETATVWLGGKLNGLSGFTVGATYYLSGTLPGQVTASPATGVDFTQRVGVASAVDTLLVEIAQPIYLT